MNKIYFFGTDWCSLCDAIYPEFQRFCDNMNITYEYIDAKSNIELLKQYNIKFYPAIVEVNKEHHIIFRGIGVNGFNKFKERHTNVTI